MGTSLSQDEGCRLVRLKVLWEGFEPDLVEDEEDERPSSMRALAARSTGIQAMSS